MEYTQTRFKLDDDYEGAVEAVLIQALPDPASVPDRTVLYLHGYVDYFFQTHMAEAFIGAGWNFYALELRKYGRSLLPHQTPYYCRSLREYYPEIDKSIQTIRASGNRRIVLLGHSTGGLIASLYAREGRERASINALVLNSPFFEFNAGWFKRAIGVPLIAIISLAFPYAHKENELSPYYFDSVHVSEKGEWNFDTRLKPKSGVPLYFAWLRAIRQGQRIMRKGLHLEIPTLVLHAEKSVRGNHWTAQYHTADAVLNVNDIKRLAPLLGDCVTVTAIADGMHDLVLSRSDVRDHVFQTMLAWLDTFNRPDVCDRIQNTDTTSDFNPNR